MLVKTTCLFVNRDFETHEMGCNISNKEQEKIVLNIQQLFSVFAHFYENNCRESGRVYLNI